MEKPLYTAQQIKELMQYATPEEKELLLQHVDGFVKEEAPIFVPQPGPQVSAYESDADVIAYGGAGGGGKGIDTTLPVPTTTGWKTIGDIEVGDEIFDGNGDVCSVTAVSEINYRQCYEIAFDCGMVIVADDVHRWVTTTEKDRKFPSPYGSMRDTKELYETQHLRHAIRKARKFNKEEGYHYIVSIEPTETVPTKCLAVDSPSHTFLVSEAMIPTHNTSLICGMALTKHVKSLIMRHEATQLQGIKDDLVRMVGHREGFNDQRGIWRDPLPGKQIEFGSMPNPGDEEKFRGRDHDLLCVAGETPVLMADGSYKAMSDIKVGDMVETMHGGRKVTKVYPVREDEAVRMDVLDAEGHVIYSQRQSMTHSVLVSGEQASHPFYFDGAKSHRADGKFSLAPLPKNQSVYSPCEWYTPHRPLLLCEEPLSRFLESRLGGSSSCAVPAIQESDCVKSSYLPEVDEPHLLGYDHLAHRLQTQKLLERGYVPEVLSSGATYVRSSSELQDSQDGYHGNLRLCDERTPEFSGLCSLQGGDQSCPPQPFGVEPPTPTRLQGDERVQTPKCIFHKPLYVHPYTTEIRQADVTLCSFAYRYLCVGKTQLYDIEIDEVNHYVTGPGIVNKNCMDEVTEMREDQVRFIQAWVRTTIPGQKCTVLMTFNPPRKREGMWIIKYFGPWLDINHPNPAMPGEKRYFATIANEDIEVPDNRPFVLVDDVPCYDYDPADYSPVDIITPESRTFIPAKLVDNVFLDERYMRKLQALPEPLRSQMLLGDFRYTLEDDPMQVIPTEWVEAAMARWHQWDGPKPPMDSLGVDVARGGKDYTELARRHGWWFDKPLSHPGSDTPDGYSTAGLAMNAVRDDAPIHIDAIGVGTSPTDILNSWNAHVFPVIANKATPATDKSTLLSFVNIRSWMWWMMRETLDPSNGHDVALPPDKQLKEDLTAPRYIQRGSKIYVQSKDEIFKKLKRSPDRGTAYVQANINTPKRRRRQLRKQAEEQTYWELA
jgi:hypothetical protein